MSNMMRTILSVLMCLCLISGGFMAVSPQPAAAQGLVNLSLQPGTLTVDVGDEFDVEIQVDSGLQQVTGVSAFINYDPAKLSVVDSDSAATGVQITPGTTLDVIIQNIVNSGVGQINYSASLFNKPYPAGTFTLATIKFRAIAATVTDTAVSFSTVRERETKVGYGGDNITGTLTNGSYAISGPVIPLPAAPTDLTGIKNSLDQVDLSWTDNSDNEDGFHIETALNAEFTASPLTITVGPNITSYTDTTTGPYGYTYYYRITAFNISGDSEPSNVASVYIPEPNGDEPPAAPSNLAASVSGTTVNLSWTDNSNNEVGFNLDRAEDDGFNTGLTTIVLGPDVTSYSDTNLAAGTYYYRIRAYNAIDVSDDSNTVSAVVEEGSSTSPPVVTTEDASDVTATTATLNGSLNDKGSASVVEVYFRWGIESGNCSDQTDTQSMSAPGNFTENLTGLIPNTTYYYQAVAIGDGEDVGEEKSFTTSAVDTLNAPSCLEAVAVNKCRVDLSWIDNSDSEDGFRIKRANNPKFAQSQSTGDSGILVEPNCVDEVVSFTVKANVTCYSDETVEAGTTYYYKILAYNSEECSPYSNTACVTTPEEIPQTPAAPSGLKAKLVNDNCVELSWVDNSNNEKGFKIETATDPKFKESLVITVCANVTIYSDTSVYPGDTFYYRVFAYKGELVSGPSNVASVNIPLPNGDMPASPSNLCCSVSGSKVTLTWTDNSDNENTFFIERAADANFTNKLWSESVGEGTTSYIDSGLAAGTYYYRVSAVNGAGASSPCNTVTALIKSKGSNNSSGSLPPATGTPVVEDLPIEGTTTENTPAAADPSDTAPGPEESNNNVPGTIAEASAQGMTPEPVSDIESIPDETNPSIPNNMWILIAVATAIAAIAASMIVISQVRKMK